MLLPVPDPLPELAPVPVPVLLPPVVAEPV